MQYRVIFLLSKMDDDVVKVEMPEAILFETFFLPLERPSYTLLVVTDITIL